MKKKIYTSLIFILTMIIAIIPVLLVAGNILSVSIGENFTHKNDANIFYALKKDSVDVLFLGSSSIGYGIAPIVLWNDAGITSALRWCGYQNAMTNYFYLLDSLESQSPKVVVLDAKTITFNIADFNDGLEPYLRSAIDVLPMSDVKREAINKISSLTSNPLSTKLSYYVKFLRYYSYISNLNYVSDYYKLNYGGMILNPYNLGSAISLKLNSASYDELVLKEGTDVYQCDDLSYEYFISTIEYCLKNGIEVCITSFPSADWNIEEHNLIEKICEKYQIEYIDYNTAENLEAIQLDYDQDFHDTLHLNVYGQIKVSENISRFLVNYYDLEDHRDDFSYNQWNIWYEEFSSFYIN